MSSQALGRRAQESLRRTAGGLRKTRWTGPREPRRQFDIATDNFSNELKNLKIPDETAAGHKDEVSSMEKARFMNMKLLAYLYKFIDDNGSNIDMGDVRKLRELFLDENIYDNYIRPFIPDDMTKIEKSVVSIAIKQEYLRYLMVISQHRSSYITDETILKDLIKDVPERYASEEYINEEESLSIGEDENIADTDEEEEL